MMIEEKLLTKIGLGDRWGLNVRTIDRMRKDGRLPWVDLSGGQRQKPIVRFRLRDVIEYERKYRMFPEGVFNE